MVMATVTMVMANVTMVMAIIEYDCLLSTKHNYIYIIQLHNYSKPQNLIREENNILAAYYMLTKVSIKLNILSGWSYGTMCPAPRTIAYVNDKANQGTVKQSKQK